MTDELDEGKSNRDVIVEFLSCGPKNYAYKTRLGKTEEKIRGFTLNVRGQQRLHFRAMKDTLLLELRSPLSKPRTINVPNPHKRGGKGQTRLAKALHALARVPEGPCGLGALHQFQIVLPDYHIKIFSADESYQVIFVQGEKRADQRYLFLLKHEDHYYGLKSIPAILGRKRFCHLCDKGLYSKKMAHHHCSNS